MEQNVVVFPNSMYPHVGPYTPYFCFGYGGIVSVLTIWPPMSDPLIVPTALPKLVSGIAQTRIVRDREEPLNEDEDCSERKRNPGML
jgi:hypothetical protein